MAAATITRLIQTADPATEVVVLTASDAETYTSRKFNQVVAVSATDNNDTGTPISATCTGTTAVVTVQWTGVTDKLCTLVLYGHQA